MNDSINKTESGKIYLKGTASETYTCDKVSLEIKFYCSNVSGAKASEAVVTQCERFLERLSQAGVDIKQIQLDSDHIGQPSYRDDNKVTASRTLKFSAEANAEINNYVLKIIQEEHLDADVSTNYFLSNENELRKQLRLQAIADSRETADMLATAAGKQVIGVDAIDVDGHISHVKHKRGLVAPSGTDEIFCIFSRELSMPTKKLTEEATVTWLIE